MPVVILCSSHRNSSLFNTLYTSLSVNGGALALSDKNVISASRYPEFTLFKTDRVPDSLGVGGVIVFDDCFKNSSAGLRGENLVPIFESCNKKAAAVLKGASTTAIPCGTNPHDTLSIASISPECATVSLQRDLTDIYGNVYEPHDFQVKLLKPLAPYPLLCTCAALLMCGCSSEKGYII